MTWRCTDSIGGIATALLVACHSGKGDGGDTAPPRICNASSAWSGGTAYEERTSEWGLEGVTATRVSVADLDGDGYPDLVASEGGANRRDDFAGGVRYHWVLMNREDGSGGRTFVDETEPSGLFAPRDGTRGVGASAEIHVFADVDNDGDIDVFSGSYYDANDADHDTGDRSEVYLNDGTGHFTLARESDIHIDGGYATSGAAFVDFDHDGFIDLWVVGWYERYGYLYAEQDHLYKGAGDGTFTDVTDSAGLEMVRGTSLSDWLDGRARRPAYGATACDLDGDGYDDLLASNYGRAWNQQWMNQGDGTFADTAMESGYAGDDDLDYSDNQFYRCWCEENGCDPDPGPAMLSPCSTYADYWTPGFDDQPARLNGNTFSTACGDIDNDGDMDLISAEIRHWHIGESSDPTELLLNDGTANFTRPGNDEDGLARNWSEPDWNEGDLMVAMMDFDNDGWKDILLNSSDYPDDRMFLFRQLSPQERSAESATGSVFAEVGEETGMNQPWPAGLAVADFDRDGDLDVVTGSSTARSGTPWDDHALHFYENVLGPGNSLRIELEGTQDNGTGIGAKVVVEAGGLTQVQQMQGGYGHFGMDHDQVLHFGLGDACDVDAVTVIWPTGVTDSWSDIPANYEVRLTEGGGWSIVD